MIWIIIKGVLISAVFAGCIVGLGFWVEASEISSGKDASVTKDAGDDAEVTVHSRDGGD